MSETGAVDRVTLQTDDFEELQEIASDWDQQYFQMTPGSFRGEMEMTIIGSTQIFREHWSRKIRYRGTAPMGAYGIALPFEQPGTGNWLGRRTGQNSVIMQGPGREADLVSSDHWDALVLGLPEVELLSIVSALSGGVDLSDTFHGVVSLSRDAAEKLRRQGREFLVRSRSASPQDDELISRLAEQLVKQFVWELVGTLEKHCVIIKPSRPARIVKQATGLMLAHNTRSIGLVEICADLNVSLRTLHYAFQDVTGMSPATWLRRIRLNRIHKTLLHSAPDEILIKQVAINNGFLHAGHFSDQYQRLFGCLPSETLRLR